MHAVSRCLLFLCDYDTIQMAVFGQLLFWLNVTALT